MTWEEFKSIGDPFYLEPYSPTGVECPNCGHQIWRNNQVILTSNPPQYEYKCPKCGWIGHR